MGRGDRKTTKGKIAIRSFGNVRPHRTKAATPGVAKPVKTGVAKKSPVTKAPARKTAPAKKAAAKKSA